MTDLRTDPVVTALSALVPSGVVRGRLTRPDGRQLCWIEAGSTGPTVILVAGAGDTTLDWATVLPSLAEGCRVIAYDRAGLGASDPIRRLTLGSQVDDLVALLDATGPAVLVGHSWGGLLVQLAAFTRRQSILGLVLVDPSHEDFHTALPVIIRVRSSLTLHSFVPMKVVGLFDRLAARMGRALAERYTEDPQIQALFVDAYVASYTTIGQVRMISAENRLPASCADRVRATRAKSDAPNVPMRILTATKNKPPTLIRHSHNLAEQTVAAFPLGLHVAVPDSGHYIHHDQPAAVVEAIVAVIAQIAEDPPPS